jgi:sulfonate transport system ATP-binding protein
MAYRLTLETQTRFRFPRALLLAMAYCEKNITFGMEIKGVPSAEREHRVEKIMDLVGLSDCTHLYPNQISSSMEQRVAVARAFATQPDLLLMDEPYGQMDVKLRSYLEDELIRLWQELKSTVIFVTHNIEEVCT